MIRPHLAVEQCGWEKAIFGMDFIWNFWIECVRVCVCANQIVTKREVYPENGILNECARHCFLFRMQATPNRQKRGKNIFFVGFFAQNAME